MAHAPASAQDAAFNSSQIVRQGLHVLRWDGNAQPDALSKSQLSSDRSMPSNAFQTHTTQQPSQQSSAAQDSPAATPVAGATGSQVHLSKAPTEQPVRLMHGRTTAAEWPAGATPFGTAATQQPVSLMHPRMSAAQRPVRVMQPSPAATERPASVGRIAVESIGGLQWQLQGSDADIERQIFRAMCHLKAKVRDSRCAAMVSFPAGQLLDENLVLRFSQHISILPVCRLSFHQNSKTCWLMKAASSGSLAQQAACNAFPIDFRRHSQRTRDNILFYSELFSFVHNQYSDHSCYVQPLQVLCTPCKNYVAAGLYSTSLGCRLAHLCDMVIGLEALRDDSDIVRMLPEPAR